jgi:hypothetical protein
MGVLVQWIADSAYFARGDRDDRQDNGGPDDGDGGYDDSGF